MSLVCSRASSQKDVSVKLHSQRDQMQPSETLYVKPAGEKKIVLLPWPTLAQQQSPQLTGCGRSGLTCEPRHHAKQTQTNANVKMSAW